MRPIGFSTGALALGDFERGLELQRRDGINAIELSALRENELDRLIDSLPTLNLSHFVYRSFHAPSELLSHSNDQVVEKLRHVADQGFYIVVHPDIISDFAPWRGLGSNLLLENMDQRKPVCRTANEMFPYFCELPESQFCFDIGHARQVDPTMSVAVDFIMRFRNRVAEIHISDVNWQCRHVPISSLAALAYWRISRLIDAEIPVIIESQVEAEQIEIELQTVRSCLRWDQPFLVEARAQQPAVLQPGISSTSR